MNEIDNDTPVRVKALFIFLLMTYTQMQEEDDELREYVSDISSKLVGNSQLTLIEEILPTGKCLVNENDIRVRAMSIQSGESTQNGLGVMKSRAESIKSLGMTHKRA